MDSRLPNASAGAAMPRATTQSLPTAASPRPPNPAAKPEGGKAATANSAIPNPQPAQRAGVATAREASGPEQIESAPIA